VVLQSFSNKLYDSNTVIKEPGSCIVIVSGLRGGRYGFESQQVQQIFLCHRTPRPARRLTQPPVRSVLQYVTASKATGRQVHHSYPFTTEVKNQWSYTSFPPISPHGVEWDSCTVLAVRRVSHWPLPVTLFPVHYMRLLKTRKVCLCVCHMLSCVCMSVCDEISPPESLGGLLTFIDVRNSH
jgi:hypothetical protein